jgi:hypothetical protein
MEISKYIPDKILILSKKRKGVGNNESTDTPPAVCCRIK